MDTPQNPTNIDDYSPAVTLIPFDRPISLLRGPIPADPPDDPFVLAFGDPQIHNLGHLRTKHASTRSPNNARLEFESGAPSAHPISVHSHGGKIYLVYPKKTWCKEREMASCLEASKSSCRKFAKDKCLPAAFRGARIAMDGDKNVNWRYASKLIAWVSMLDERVGLDLWRMKGSSVEFKSRVGLTICRGSDLLDTDTDTTVNGN